MRIQMIQSNYNDNFSPAFKAVIIEKSAAKVIETLPETEKQEFNNIIQRVSDTKFWDMRLSKVIRNADEFWCDFVNKKNPKKVYKLGISPLNAKDSKVEIYPVISDDNSKLEKIRFSSPQRAQAMLDTKKRHHQEMIDRNFKSSNLQRLARWVDNLEFLDEAYRYMKSGEVYPFDGPQNVVKKPTLMDRISDFFGLS